MIFHENRLLADDSHVISYLIFVENLGKMSQNLSSAAVVIGALRVNSIFPLDTLTPPFYYSLFQALTPRFKTLTCGMVNP